MGIFRSPPRSFLELQSWKKQNLNALRYNTAQQGSVVPMVYGTKRVQVNVIDLDNYRGPKTNGKGTTSLPLGGTPSSNTAGGKGGSGGGKGSKKGGNQHYSVNVAFALCEGGDDVGIPSGNRIWANGSTADVGSLPLNVYSGANGQAPDPVFAGRGHDTGYSSTLIGTCTPMDLGTSPVLPNLAAEVSGYKNATGGANFPRDANPGDVITHFLTDPQRGAQFPAANLDTLLAGDGTTYGDYCQAAGMLVSVELDGQQDAGQWLDGLARLTNTAVCWSGELLKLVPFGDVALDGNGATWAPNLVPVYSLTDDHFLPWHAAPEGSGPDPGQEDPIQGTRSNPAWAANWVTIEYEDRDNDYTATPLPVYDQGAIDRYGRRGGGSLSGKAFANQTSAQVAAQIWLQEQQYDRNTYRFRLGWQFDLLELMDIVLLTGRSTDSYLFEQPVRITAITEDDNGDLTIEAKEIVVGAAATPRAPGRIELIAGARSPDGDGSPPLGPFALHADFGYLGTAVGAAGLTTTGPTVLVAFIASLQTAEVPHPPLEDTPFAYNVAGSSLGGFTLRSRFSQNPTNGGLFPPGVGAIEMWWKAAPEALTNEVVTLTYGPSGCAAGLLHVLAFTGASLSDPWDHNVSLPKSNSNPLATAIVPTVGGISTDGPGLLLSLAACWNGLINLVASTNWEIQAPGAGQAIQVFVGILMSDLICQLHTTEAVTNRLGENYKGTAGFWLMAVDALAAE